MTVSTRKEAISQGLLRYVTGKACINGHTTHRYTKSGACAGCVADAANRGVRASVAPTAPDERRKTAEMVSAAREGMVSTRIRTFDVDLGKARAMALMMCQARWPGVSSDVFRDNLGPTKPTNGSAMYSYTVPIEDAEVFKAYVVALFSDHLKWTPEQRDAHMRLIHGRLAALEPEPEGPYDKERPM